MSVAANTPRRWTREECDRLIEQGTFQVNERLELIEGENLEMTPQNARHVGTVTVVYGVLDDALLLGYFLRGQIPLALGQDSEPEPNFAVVAGNARDYLEAYPTTAALVVDVSDSSLPLDRGRKLPLYARSDNPEAWFVSVAKSRLEVHRKPEGGAFREHEMLTPRRPGELRGTPRTGGCGRHAVLELHERVGRAPVLLSQAGQYVIRRVPGATSARSAGSWSN